ncbi:MAG: nitroreductase family protein [Desulfobulbaceae bacterium]|nr:nitroreductase family protein [Desulfobulbaceae bacterium]
MSLITIDKTKCKKDGICAGECPFSLIVDNKEDGFPELRPAAAKLCIRCGHCLAVCPHQALTFDQTSPADCLNTNRKTLPSPEATRQLLMERRSIRTYRNKPVDREILSQIIDASRWAPSAKNMQPVNWLIIENPEEVKRLSGHVVEYLKEVKAYPGLIRAWDNGRDMVLRGAPHLAVAHASAAKSLHPEIDSTIALTYFDLAAASHGVGTCWAGILMGAADLGYQPLLDALNLPEGHKVYGALMVGYPKFKYFRIPPRREPIVTWRK